MPITELQPSCNEKTLYRGPDPKSPPVEMSHRFFRAGTLVAPKFVNFVVTMGGIGDHICNLGCLQWIARNHPQIHGIVYCGDFLSEIAKNVFKHFPTWEVRPREALTEQAQEEYPTLGPCTYPINGVGAHLLDLAFIYYLGFTPAPKDAYMPTLDFDGVAFPGELAVGQLYAVLTPGAISSIRTLPPKCFNQMKDHLISKGILPVLLGRTEVLPTRTARFHEEYDFKGCLNLIDKTSLVEAAHIISRAKLIAGLDNGLLHLAGCTETPIIFGYNIASPEHRKPKRPKGRIWNIAPDPKVLTCTFCQSQMRLMTVSHAFDACIYDDYLCLQMIAADAVHWNACIDDILKEEETGKKRDFMDEVF